MRTYCAAQKTTQYSMVTCMGEESKKRVNICIIDSLAVQQILTQHCKSTILH